MSECRICASTDAIFLNIFQKSDKRKYDTEINTCLPIKVTIDDVISLKICHVCVHKLELCSAFVCRFLATEPQRKMDSGQNLCYLCLGGDGILSSLFDIKFNWIHKIETALGCKVHRGKKVPSKICHHCAYKLGELYHLFLSALDSESKLYMMCEKSSMKMSPQSMPTKSLASGIKKASSADIRSLMEKTTVRVSARKVKPTEARDGISAGLQSNLNSSAAKVLVTKLSEHNIRSGASQLSESSDITLMTVKFKGKDKQMEISPQIIEGRVPRRDYAEPENKLKIGTKGNKATLKPVDNINVSCWKCFRDVKDNETCSCSADFDGGTKTKKVAPKVDVKRTLGDITPFNKMEVAANVMINTSSKRKRENEDFVSDNSKKVRIDKKPVQRKRESVPLVSHVYDIRRTKRKRTITDYNQLLNDGLLLSPRVGKKDVKSVQKATPFKVATKTLVSNKLSAPISSISRKNSQKLTDMKLENQENVPQKAKSVEANKLKQMHAHTGQSKSGSLKSAKVSLSPKRKISKETSLQNVEVENNLDKPVPAEKLNKYECSICNEHFPSTVEGKLHEIMHTARIMKLIMYRWADNRSSDQSTSSKQSQKNAGKPANSRSNATNDKEAGGVTKEIKKVLQDVVSSVSEDPSNKSQKIDGINITRTRGGRIVVSKLPKTLRTARNKARKISGDAAKHDETVRSIISDFESLEEREEIVGEISPTITLKNSFASSVGTVAVDKCVRKNKTEESLNQTHDGSNTVCNSSLNDHIEDLNSESHCKQKSNQAFPSVSPVPTAEPKQSGKSEW